MLAGKHIVIVGGGITGVATSYFLAKRGVACTLVDPVGIAPAASGKAGGFLALDWNDGAPVGPLARKSFSLHEELARVLGETTVDYRRLTCQAVTCTGGAQKRAAGVEWADLGVLGSRPMGDESTIAQVHPKKLCDALWAEAARLAGSTLVRGYAEGVERDEQSGALRAVQVDGERVAADCVVLAMGPWSPTWFGLPQAYGTKYHSLLMRPRRTLSQCVFFDCTGPTLASLLQGLGDPEAYPRPDGTVYCTGFPDPPAVVSERPGEVEVRADVAARLESAMRQVSSELQAAPVEAQQACHLPTFADGVPVIGAVPGVPGAYVASGGGCWGILCGPATGLALSELILDGAAASVDITPFSPQRFA